LGFTLGIGPRREFLEMNTTFVPLVDAAIEYGVSQNTVKRRFRTLNLTVFRDSRDLRRRLLRRSDLETAFGPPVPLGTSSDVTPSDLLDRGSARCQNDY